MQCLIFHYFNWAIFLWQIPMNQLWQHRHQRNNHSNWEYDHSVAMTTFCNHWKDVNKIRKMPGKLLQHWDQLALNKAKMNLRTQRCTIHQEHQFIDNAVSRKWKNSFRKYRFTPNHLPATRKQYGRPKPSLKKVEQKSVEEAEQDIEDIAEVAASPSLPGALARRAVRSRVPYSGKRN